MSADRWSGGVLFLLGLGVGWEAWRLPFGTVRTPDSGFFPLILALALLVFSAIVMLATWAPGAAPDPLPSAHGLVRVVVTVAALAGYALLVERLGYLLATGLVALLLLRGIERVSWLATLGVTLGSVLGSYLLFRRLGVPLPSGLLPF